jgi:hypothetical protein
MRDRASIFRFIVLLSFVCLSFDTPRLHALEVGLDQNARCVEAGMENTVSIKLSGDTRLLSEPSPQLFGFLKIAGRTVARDSVEISRQQTGLFHASLKLKIPPVKDSLIVPAELELVLQDSANGTVLADAKEFVFIFHEDPFLGHRDYLERLPIRIFDPGGEVVKAFESEIARIPFQKIYNRRQITTVNDGVLVIGVDAGGGKRARRLTLESAATAAQNGALVVVLAFPSSMEVLPGMPGADTHAPDETTPIKRIRLEKSDVIKRFDKRFDILLPPPESQRADGWAWYEAEYQSGGRLIVTNLPLIEQWQKSPVPRYLFRELVTRTPPRKKTQMQ